MHRATISGRTCRRTSSALRLLTCFWRMPLANCCSSALARQAGRRHMPKTLQRRRARPARRFHPRLLQGSSGALDSWRAGQPAQIRVRLVAVSATRLVASPSRSRETTRPLPLRTCLFSLETLSAMYCFAYLLFLCLCWAKSLLQRTGCNLLV